MLKREYRLKKKYQFNYVYRVGKTAHGKFLVAVYSPSKNKNVRIGISVSKKVGNAVQRNRARRLLREAISQFLDKLDPNFNIIIVGKQSILEQKSDSVTADLKAVLERTDLLSWKSSSPF